MARLSGVVDRAVADLNAFVLSLGEPGFGTPEEEVELLRRRAGLLCAGVSLIPVPFVDVVTQTPIQLAMVVGIGQRMGMPLVEQERSAILRDLLGILGWRYLARHGTLALVKVGLPLVGSILSLPAVYAWNYALGKLAEHYFLMKSEGRPLDRAAKRDLRMTFNEGREEGLRQAQKEGVRRAARGAAKDLVREVETPQVIQPASSTVAVQTPVSSAEVSLEVPEGTPGLSLVRDIVHAAKPAAEVSRSEGVSAALTVAAPNLVEPDSVDSKTGPEQGDPDEDTVARTSPTSPKPAASAESASRPPARRKKTPVEPVGNCQQPDQDIASSRRTPPGGGRAGGGQTPLTRPEVIQAQVRAVTDDLMGGETPRDEPVPSPLSARRGSEKGGVEEPPRRRAVRKRVAPGVPAAPATQNVSSVEEAAPSSAQPSASGKKEIPTDLPRIGSLFSGLSGKRRVAEGTAGKVVRRGEQRKQPPKLEPEAAEPKRPAGVMPDPGVLFANLPKDQPSAAAQRADLDNLFSGLSDKGDLKRRAVREQLDTMVGEKQRLERLKRNTAAQKQMLQERRSREEERQIEAERLKNRRLVQPASPESSGAAGNLREGTAGGGRRNERQDQGREVRSRGRDERPHGREERSTGRLDRDQASGNRRADPIHRQPGGSGPGVEEDPFGGQVYGGSGDSWAESSRPPQRSEGDAPPSKPSMDQELARGARASRPESGDERRPGEGRTRRKRRIGGVNLAQMEALSSTSEKPRLSLEERREILNRLQASTDPEEIARLSQELRGARKTSAEGEARGRSDRSAADQEGRSDLRRTQGEREARSDRRGMRPATERSGGRGTRPEVERAGGRGTRSEVERAGGRGTRSEVERSGGRGTRPEVERAGGRGMTDRPLPSEGGEGRRSRGRGVRRSRSPVETSPRDTLRGSGTVDETAPRGPGRSPQSRGPALGADVDASEQFGRPRRRPRRRGGDDGARRSPDAVATEPSSGEKPTKPVRILRTRTRAPRSAPGGRTPRSERQDRSPQRREGAGHSKETTEIVVENAVETSALLDGQVAESTIIGSAGDVGAVDTSPTTVQTGREKTEETGAAEDAKAVRARRSSTHEVVEKTEETGAAEDAKAVKTRRSSTRKVVKKTEKAGTAEDAKPVKARSSSTRKVVKKTEKAGAEEDAKPVKARRSSTRKVVEKTANAGAEEEAKPVRARRSSTRKVVEKTAKAGAEEEAKPVRARRSSTRKVVEKIPAMSAEKKPTSAKKKAADVGKKTRKPSSAPKKEKAKAAVEKKSTERRSGGKKKALTKGEETGGQEPQS